LSSFGSSPRVAAFLKKLGGFVLPADVNGREPWLLDPEDAAELSAGGAPSFVG
jgi:hypothetical protein